MTESQTKSYALRQINERTNDYKLIVIRNSQLLLGLMSSLLLIGVGLIGFGKKTGLTATM